MNALHFVIPRMLVLLRGLPGSGKSTLAAAVASASAAVAAESESSAANPVVASADDFFVDADGKYQVGSGCSLQELEMCIIIIVHLQFVPSLVGRAHEWCQAKVFAVCADAILTQF